MLHFFYHISTYVYKFIPCGPLGGEEAREGPATASSAQVAAAVFFGMDFDSQDVSGPIDQFVPEQIDAIKLSQQLLDVKN